MNRFGPTIVYADDPVFKSDMLGLQEKYTSLETDIQHVIRQLEARILWGERCTEIQHTNVTRISVSIKDLGAGVGKNRCTVLIERDEIGVHLKGLYDNDVFPKYFDTGAVDFVKSRFPLPD